jgi:hypothetical protein
MECREYSSEKARLKTPQPKRVKGRPILLSDGLGAQNVTERDLNARVLTVTRVSAAMREKHDFSKQHLQTAEFFADEAQAMEAAHPQVDETQRLKHRAYVTGAVLFFVAYLEASTNELYLSAIDQSVTTLPGFDARLFQLLARFWTADEKSSILDKYQDMLRLSDKNLFSKGESPCQPGNDVIKLREALLHYKSEWDDETGQHQKLENRLSKKFALNRYAPTGSLWFPHQCLGTGCAKWAVAKMRAFSDEICDRLAILRRS